MSIKYDLFENPPRAGKKEEGWLHARPVIQGTLRTERLIRSISESCTLTGADVKGVLESLSERLCYGLSNSYNVYLEGIGTFSVTLKSKPVKDKKEIRSASVEFKNVEFRPDPRLKRKLQLADMSRVAPKEKRATFEGKERRERLWGYILTHHSINVTTAMAINHANHKKTKEDLLFLVEKGLVKELHHGNAKIYIRNPEPADHKAEGD
ncbi:MAG: HU family DNA-binding protein [Tannerellaceae bacterium]|nr:HU family DNA-binding protein [Tannerellaceae bacterium]